MNYDKIKHSSELDSRRVSTGVLCRIICDEDRADSFFKGLLKKLKGFGFWPQHVNNIPLTTGVDPATGVCILMPLHMVPFFKGEWKNLIKNLNVTFNERDENGKVNVAIGKARRTRLNAEFKRNIQEHLIIGTLYIHDKSSPPDGRRDEVYIETREQSEPRSTLIEKGQSDSVNEPNVFTSQQNPSIKKWTDAQKRGR